MTETPPSSSSKLPILAFNRGVLTLDGWPGDPGNKLGIKWTHQSETNLWVASASQYRKVKKEGLEDRVPAWQQLEPLEEALLHSPNKLQVEAIAAWKAAKFGMVVMPTGTGKTEVALHIIRDMRASTLIVVPTRDMMYQWQRRISRALGYEAGLIGDQRQIIKPISVATYHSACLYMDRLGDRYEMVVYDEVHHLPGEIRGDASRMCAAPMRLGLTATPPSGDRLNTLIELAGPPLFERYIHQTSGDSLAEYEVVPCPVEMTDKEREEYDELKTKVGAFFDRQRKNGKPRYSHEDLCADAGHDREAKQILRATHRQRSLEHRAEAKINVLEDLFLMHPSAPTIIWAGDNEFAREISRTFLIPCILSHCLKPERDYILDGFESGKYKAIVSCKLLTEGIDVPKAKVGICLGGSGSKTEATQKLGRIVRKTGGVHAVFYDVYCERSADQQRSKKRRPKARSKSAGEAERLLC
jgi:superfamily II DNA or RNA helicase